MTGTASEFLNEKDYSVPIENNFDLLSSWLFGQINTNCTLHEIDKRGCIIIMPLSQSIPPDVFKLIIMSSDAPKNVHSILSAQVYWVEGDFSSKYQQVSVMFVDLDESLYGEINLLKACFEGNVGSDIKCCILNARC